MKLTSLFLIACAMFGQRLVIQTSTILDGKGGTVRNAQIVVDGTKIVSVDRAARRPITICEDSP